MEDIYIYGAGNRGYELLDIIKNRYQNVVNVKGFIDLNKTGEINGVHIYNITQIIKQAVIVISIYDFDVALQVAINLKKNGYINIYWYNLNNKRNKPINFLKEICSNCRDWYEDTLLHVEMHAMDACNLNCKGCTHFAPLFKNVKPNFSERINDVKLLSQKVSGVVDFYILGGEPLMNDELEKYVEAVKSIFPNSNVLIVTNGILIPKCSQKLLEFLSAQNVYVSISEYAPTHLMIDKIIEKLNMYNIIYNVRCFDKKQKFNKPLSIKKSTEKYCISQNCINIFNGKIACCPTLMYLPELNKKYGLSLPEGGTIDLLSDINGSELKNKLYQKVPLCDYCIQNEIDWAMCNREPLVTDFVEF